MEALGKLFGSKDIVKILRLFILNPGEHFDLTDIEKRTKVDRDIVRQEINMLERIGFVRRRSFYKEYDVPRRRGRGARQAVVKKRRRVTGYTLEQRFAHLEGLRLLVAGGTVVSERELARKLNRTGRLKLVVLSGIFVGDLTSRLDLLVAGDRLRHAALEHVIRDLEAELGREIRYAAFTTDDFKYRLSMHDRLLRDTFDFAHNTVVDRLGVEEETLGSLWE